MLGSTGSVGEQALDVVRAMPDRFTITALAAGLNTAGGCGDTVRNITGCPVAGLGHGELFDASDVVRQAARFARAHLLRRGRRRRRERSRP